MALETNNLNFGYKCYNLAKKLWPINRSLTGVGVRQTLSIIKNIIPSITVHEIRSGEHVFDWTIPNEWIVREAWIKGPNGEKILDYMENNLHLVGYSTPVYQKLDLIELKNKIFSLPKQRNAIPYVTSYYKESWGFCMSQEQLENLPKGRYEVYIDSEFKSGSLTYGEVKIKGRSQKEVLISTYICHPSMANNELSGPVIATFITEFLQKQKDLRYSYRIIFVPETIGAIAYIKRNLKELRKNVVAGFVLTCMGDEGSFSFMPSKYGNTYADKIAKHVLKNLQPTFKEYTFLDRGSDERQYCSPGVDLPVVSIMKSKYGEYAEYHTSLDNLEFITENGLAQSFDAIMLAIQAIEVDCVLTATKKCEPFLTKYDLYSTTSIKNSTTNSKRIVDILTYSDGSNTLIDIAELIHKPVWELYNDVNLLAKYKLISLSSEKK
jgi:aminopeptidase-like protein